MSKPWAHQLEYVDFALRYCKTCAMHDTGIGKTRSAIMVADALFASRVLVICPAIACEHWVDQFARYGALTRSSFIMRPGRSDPLAGIVIVPFSMLSTNTAVRPLLGHNFDLVVIDEAHALKTPDARRTVAVYGQNAKGGGLADLAPYIVLLTATLMPNHPAELWTHLRALWPDLLAAPGDDSVVDRYCERKWALNGDKIVGAKRKAASDLRQRLSTFRHRVRKKDVLDLPPLIVDVWPVEVTDLSVPSEIIDEWFAVESRLKRDIGAATGEDALSVARASPHCATQRRVTGLIKTAAMIEVLREELMGSDCKVISFACHTTVIDTIEKSLSSFGVVTLDGRTPGVRRRAVVEAFQKRSNIRLFNGQLITAGESIDLSVSSSIWIMESDWTPKSITQAIGRAHRHGQTESVTVRFLTLKGTIDEALTRTLARKARDIEVIMEDL